MFSPCSEKIRASEKDLPVKDIKIQSMRYYPTQSDPILDPEGPIRPKNMLVNFWHIRFGPAQNIFGFVNRRKRLWILVPFKVHIFWEGHKILRNLPLTFDRMYCSQKLGEDFAKFLWPSQNIWTLSKTFQKSQCNWFFLIIADNFRCPTENSSYRILEGQCYFFGKVDRDYSGEHNSPLQAEFSSA